MHENIGFMHGITNPDLIKKLNENVPKSLDEIMSVTTSFLRGEVAVANQSKKKAPPTWKQYETGHRPNFDNRLDFKSQNKSSRRQDRFTPLTETPKEILGMDTVKFKAPPPMTGLVENQNKNKFCEFHGDKGHITDECIHLRRQIEEVVKSGQPSHLVKEIKQGGKQREQENAAKKWEAPNKEKAMAIFMVFVAIQRYHRPSGLRKIQEVQSTAHGMLKFPVKGGITTIRGSTIMPAECRMITEAHDISLPKEPTAMEGIKVAIHPDETPFEHSRRIPTHKAKKEGTGTDMNKAIQEEVAKLVESEIMREVQYHDWLSNLVMLNVKIGFSVGARHKKAEEILPSTLGRADFIVEKPDEEGPSIEVQAKEAFNNEAEYEALVVGLRIAEKMGVKNLIAKVDSCLVANQFNGSYEAKEQSMTQYLEKARTLINNFKMFSIEQVPRSENKKSDALSKIASTNFAYLTKQVLVETLERKSIEERKILAIVKEKGYCWMTPMVEYLTKGPFPEGQWKVKFLIVSIDYFTKWIESKQVETITGIQVRKFVWDNIVCRFGLPREIISDNEKQFKDNPFKDWCEKLNIKQRFAFVKYPQTNGQVERANRSLGEGIKARLGDDNRNWVEEVSHVLWAHRTMIKTSNEDTLFSLTYGTEAVIPVEIGMPSIRYAQVNQAENDKELLLNLDILEERREKAAVREARNKSKMEKYYNAKVRSTSFRPGGFVCHSNEASHARESGKLGPKWEGPYEVIEALGKGVYKLRNRSGDVLPRT
nr:reverse transcriptase domain-containing protein [Tanacetum cinerariifolium]